MAKSEMLKKMEAIGAENRRPTPSEILADKWEWRRQRIRSELFKYNFIDKDALAEELGCHRASVTRIIRELRAESNEFEDS